VAKQRQFLLQFFLPVGGGEDSSHKREEQAGGDEFVFMGLVG